MPSTKRVLRALALAALLFAPPLCAADLVVLVSIDGFRADYLERGLTPALSGMAQRGTRARAMEPAFPSVTFPNHYSLVTGLTPDHHGIVNNTMRDPALPGHTFRLSDRDEMSNPLWWNGGIPIWETLHRLHLKTGTVFWPGSEVAIHGVQPDYWRPYDGSLSVNDRVDAVLQLLSLPATQRPVFVTLYFNTVDRQGHIFGPDSGQVDAALREVDAGLARLEQGLRERQLLAHANLVIVADHGMAETSPEQTVSLDEYLDPASYDSINSGATVGIYDKPGKAAAIDAALAKPMRHMQCWRKENMPQRFHFGGNPRIPPFYCLAEVGWTIISHDAKPYDGRGEHGYDPASPDMAALFVAAGPAFKPGSTIGAVPGLHTVDVYALLAHLLAIKAEKNDGSLAPFRDSLLRP